MADHRRDAGGGIGGALPPVPPPPASIAGKPPPPPPLASRFSSRSNSRGSSRGGSLEPAKPGTVAEESPRRPRRRSSINAAEISSLTAEMETYENREKQLREREAAGQADRNSLEEVKFFVLLSCPRASLVLWRCSRLRPNSLSRSPRHLSLPTHLPPLLPTRPLTHPSTHPLASYAPGTGAGEDGRHREGDRVVES